MDLYQLHWRDRLQERGIGYLAYGPLAFGMLTGTIGEDTTFGPDDWRSGGQGVGHYRRLFAPWKRGHLVERVDRLRSIAERSGAPLPTVALRWVLDQEGVTGAIAGSRHAHHIRSNASAGDLELDQPTLDEIEGIFG